MSGFARAMKLTTAATALLTAASTGAYFSFGGDVYETLAITFGTFFYHFAMRLAVGEAFDRVLGNRADLAAPWFRPRQFERRLYRALNVKRWKGKMPSYDPDLFDMRKHSPEEIAMAMCQAELVHEVCALLSFAPLLAARWFGSFGVFFITSLLSACVDLAFVAMQRYNRPRVVKLAKLRLNCR